LIPERRDLATAIESVLALAGGTTTSTDDRARLLGLDRGVIAMADRMEFVLSDPVGSLLGRIERLEALLPTSLNTISYGPTPQVRGPIDWPRTLSTRGRSTFGVDEYYCAWNVRTFDGPAARLLVAQLTTVWQTGCGLKRMPRCEHVPVDARELVEERANAARSALRGRVLRDVSADRSARNCAAIRRGTDPGRELLRLERQRRLEATPRVMSMLMSWADLDALSTREDTTLEVPAALPATRIARGGLLTR
jgi:hypothetical protein